VGVGALAGVAAEDGESHGDGDGADGVGRVGEMGRLLEC
jgi:hypothetical protein